MKFSAGHCGEKIFRNVHYYYCCYVGCRVNIMDKMKGIHNLKFTMVNIRAYSMFELVSIYEN